MRRTDGLLGTDELGCRGIGHVDDLDAGRALRDDDPVAAHDEVDRVARGRERAERNGRRRSAHVDHAEPPAAVGDERHRPGDADIVRSRCIERADDRRVQRSLTSTICRPAAPAAT
jgi:hypothetical protein